MADDTIILIMANNIKVSFITIHVGANFGSVLQTIATYYVLKGLGINPTCVNYIPPRVTKKRYWSDAINGGPIKFIERLVYYPIRIYSEFKYSSYLKKHCNLSKPIYSEEDFSSVCPKADVYVTGSDQVWNFVHNEGCDKHYFFDGIKGKKICYATSIGMTELPQDYYNYMKQALKDYSAFSVRESSAVTLLKSLGYDATLVLDPTFMLRKEEWCKYASKRFVEKPYIFVYLPYNTVGEDMIYKTITKIAKQKGLTIVTYSPNLMHYHKADKTITFAGPGDVLSLFYYADFVVTNSFHGTAFSINLNKQFFVYYPSNFSTRISSILDLCGLKQRLLDSVVSDSAINETIDFTKPNEILDNERLKAQNFINKAIYG